MVFLHCLSYRSQWEDIVDVVTRFAVPFFFLVSGYFAYKEEFSYRRTGKRLVKTIAVALCAALFYIVIKGIRYGTFSFLIVTEKRQWLRFFLFNYSFLSSLHLWYLYALIYCYLFLLFVQKFRLQKYIKYYVVFALTFNFFLQYVMPVISSVQIYDYYSRNALLTGIPFFSIGYLIRQKNIDLTKIKNIWLVVCIVGGCLCSILEHILFDKLFDLYIGTIFFGVGIFCFALKNKSFGKGALSFCGREYSLILYVIHYEIIYGGLLQSWFGDASWYAVMPQWLFLFFILAISFAVSVVVKSIFQLVKKFFR